MAYSIDLSGKTAVITGSNSGIGLGIAWALARAGADVVLNSFTDRDEDHAIAKDIATETGVTAHNGRCRRLAHDLDAPPGNHLARLYVLQVLGYPNHPVGIVTYQVGQDEGVGDEAGLLRGQAGAEAHRDRSPAVGGAGGDRRHESREEQEEDERRAREEDEQRQRHPRGRATRSEEGARGSTLRRALKQVAALVEDPAGSGWRGARVSSEARRVP